MNTKSVIACNTSPKPPIDFHTLLYVTLSANLCQAARAAPQTRCPKNLGRGLHTLVGMDDQQRNNPSRSFSGEIADLDMSCRLTRTRKMTLPDASMSERRYRPAGSHLSKAEACRPGELSADGDGGQGSLSTYEGLMAGHRTYRLVLVRRKIVSPMNCIQCLSSRESGENENTSSSPTAIVARTSTKDNVYIIKRSTYPCNQARFHLATLRYS